MRVQQHNRWIRRLSLISVGFSLLLLLISLGSAGGQERAMSGQLAQLPKPAGSEVKAFRDGRELLEEEKWARAAERFNDYITDYPKGANVDAALYWLAFALKKQERFREADKALQRLVTEFPNSNWADDGRALRVEIAPRLGNTEMVNEEASGSSNDEAKLVALRDLFTTNPEQALALVSNIFRPGSEATKSYKESAIMMLGRNGGQQALPLLSDIARGQSDGRLRKTAIYWLGKADDANALQVLKDVALTSTEADVGQEALSAILQQSSPGAIESLVEITRSASNLEIRKQAESLLRADAGVDGPKTKDSWLLIKGTKQLLLIPANRIIKLNGSGSLKFSRNGRQIEVPNGFAVTVNNKNIFEEREVGKGETADIIGGEIAYRERLVSGNEVVRLIADGRRTVWEFKLLPESNLSLLESGNWVTINGDFNINAAQAKDFFLYAKVGGGVQIH